ncbi:MAG: glycosyl hydrolase family 28 protein [candidate division KSB1 bacterium]|nr:glycosyl hydrolase family 28 protein [candidate division KSB1 bacterium]
MNRFIFFIIVGFALLGPLAVASPHELKVNIRDMGASGHKSEDVTAILQTAIDRCNNAGGGQVFIPPGEYTATTIELKSHVTLYLAAGAILYASNDSNAYQKRVRNVGKVKLPALIYARGARHIAIKGAGIIRGQPEFYAIPLEPYDFIQEEYAIARAAGLTPMHWLRKEPLVMLMYLTECEGVMIEDVSLIDSPFWALHLHWCQHVKVRDIYIQSDLEKAANSDGLDIDGCRDVTISGCTIKTADDAICIKSTANDGQFRDCENVIVSNCILISSSCALKLGTESHGNFRHIIFNHCVIRNTNRGLGIFIRDGGTASHIIFSDISMECNRRATQWWGSGDAFRFVVLKRHPDSRVGSIQNVMVKNIIAETQGTSRIECLAGCQQISNVTLSDVQIKMVRESQPDKRCRRGLEIINVERVRLQNISLIWDQSDPEPQWEETLLLQDVNTIWVDHFAANASNHQSRAAILVLKNVKDGVFQNCIAQPPAPLFVSISGQKTSDLIFKNNFLKHARQKWFMAAEINRKTIYFE